MEQLRITDTPAGPISYLLTRKRVKNLNLRVRNGQVSLSMPLGCPAEEADAMVRAKCRWIIQALERQWAPGPELPPEPARRECLRLLGEALDRVYPLVQAGAEAAPYEEPVGQLPLAAGLHHPEHRPGPLPGDPAGLCGPP